MRTKVWNKIKDIYLKNKKKISRLFCGLSLFMKFVISIGVSWILLTLLYLIYNEVGAITKEHEIYQILSQGAIAMSAVAVASITPIMAIILYKDYKKDIC